MVDLSTDRVSKSRRPAPSRGGARAARNPAHPSAPRAASTRDGGAERRRASTSPEARATNREARAPKRKRELDLALALMYFAFRKMIEEPDRLLAARGLGRVHHRVLFFVARRPGLSVGDLLAILDVSKQSLHRPMQKLATAGFVASRPHPKNRRIKRLFLTREGLAFEDKLSGIQRGLFRRAFAARGNVSELGFRAVLHVVGEGRAMAALNGSISHFGAGKIAAR
jgi:DNA-binding MarR family transcriptional regulator